MIIFDLDGTLADCEHRRHYVDPLHPKNIESAEMLSYDALGNLRKALGWKPNWKAFYEACDQDKPIDEPCYLYSHYFCTSEDVQIWSGRCESTRDKTIDWLFEHVLTWIDPEDEEDHLDDIILKMRPIGDSTPDDMLKEKWLDEALAEGKTIDFVVDDRPKVIRMWRRRGIFTFDVNQSGEEL